MKNVKFSLSSIEGKLSRVEMQQVVGGSVIDLPRRLGKCTSDFECPALYNCKKTTDGKYCIRVS